MRNGRLIESVTPDWIPARQILERAKRMFLDGLLQDRPQLSYFNEGQEAIYQLIRQHVPLGRQGGWNIDCRGGEQTHGQGNGVTDNAVRLEMLLKYVSRDALAGHRIVDIEGQYVTIACMDYSSGQWIPEPPIHGVEYIRRFMLHVLPKGFHRIRTSGGLLHSKKTAELQRFRQLCENQYIETQSFNDESSGCCEVKGSNKVSGKCCPHCGTKPSDSTRNGLQYDIPYIM